MPSPTAPSPPFQNKPAPPKPRPLRFAPSSRDNSKLTQVCTLHHPLGTFIIYSRRGDEITADAARDMLEPFGQLSKCEMLNTQVQAVLNLPSAVLVEFARFDPKRDLNSVSFSQPRTTSDRVVGILTCSRRPSASMTVIASTPSM